MSVSYLFWSALDCSTVNISRTNLCFWSLFTNGVLVVLDILVPSIGRALLTFFFWFWWFLLNISLKCLYFLSFLMHNYLQLFLRLFIWCSQKLLWDKIFSGYSISPSLSVMVSICMILFSSLLPVFIYCIIYSSSP